MQQKKKKKKKKLKQSKTKKYKIQSQMLYFKLFYSLLKNKFVLTNTTLSGLVGFFRWDWFSDNASLPYFAL